MVTTCRSDPDLMVQLLGLTSDPPRTLPGDLDCAWVWPLSLDLLCSPLPGMVGPCCCWGGHCPAAVPVSPAHRIFDSCFCVAGLLIFVSITVILALWSLMCFWISIFLFFTWCCTCLVSTQSNSVTLEGLLSAHAELQMLLFLASAFFLASNPKM